MTAKIDPIEVKCEEGAVIERIVKATRIPIRDIRVLSFLVPDNQKDVSE